MGTGPWPTPVFLEAWAAPVQSEAQPWQVDGLARRQRLDPLSKRRCSRVEPGALSKAQGYGFCSVGGTGRAAVAELLRALPNGSGMYEDDAFHSIISVSPASGRQGGRQGDKRSKIEWLRPGELVQDGVLRRAVTLVQ